MTNPSSVRKTGSVTRSAGAPATGRSAPVLLLDLGSRDAQAAIHSQFRILPVLGGLFITAFWEQLKATLRFLTSEIAGFIGLVLFACIVFSTVHVHAQGRDIEPYELQLRFVHYICEDPEMEPKCLAWDEQSKALCPVMCVRWRQEVTGRNSTVRFPTTAYSYTTGPPRANVMASDAAEAIYGIGFPRDRTGQPLLSRELFANPSASGWIALPPGQSREGAIAVWPQMSGVVVQDTLPATGEDLATVQVLYPSDRLAGELAVSPADALTVNTEPIFLRPRGSLPDLVDVTPEYYTQGCNACHPNRQ